MESPGREAAEAELREKLADLLKRRKALRRALTELASQDRELDRELADLRAAARVFGVDLQIPPEVSERPRVQYYVRPDGATVRRRIMPDGRVSETVTDEQLSFRPISPVPTPPPTPRSDDSSPKRPPIREIVLDRLKAAGTGGTRATAIRKYIERVYNCEIHEKTVGMTLYRLSREGSVRRDGRTWFFVPPNAETENPGVGAPGSENRQI